MGYGYYSGEVEHQYSKDKQCEYCSSPYRVGLSLEVHEMMCELNPDRCIYPSDYYIYVLELIRCEDGEVFYYVGKTDNLINRISNHVYSSNRERYGRIYMPNMNGESSDEVEYRILSVGNIVSVNGSESLALNKERELAYSLAIEKDTTNILGGR